MKVYISILSLLFVCLIVSVVFVSSLDIVKKSTVGATEVIKIADTDTYNRMFNSVVKIQFMLDQNVPESGECGEVTAACGTGVVIYSDDVKSYILTNRHIGGSSTKCGQNIKSPYINDEYRGKTVAVSKVADLALIEVAGPLPFVSPLADKALQLRDSSVVIGCPLCLDFFTETGFVGKRNLNILGSVTDQLALHIYPGNSGSPVFNVNGEVAGLVFAGTYGVSNIGFFIPLSSIKEFLSSIKYPNVIADVKSFVPQENEKVQSKYYFNPIAEDRSNVKESKTFYNPVGENLK